MSRTAIFINQPYNIQDSKGLALKLFEHTVDNAKKMYPNCDVYSDPTEDYRQHLVWKNIYKHKNDYDTAIVISSGNIFLEQEQTLKLVMEQTGHKFWWAIGHVLDRTFQGWYLRLFNSCYFLNLEELRNHLAIVEDQVFPGYRPSGLDHLPLNGFFRSEGNHHDDYTPWWVKNNPDAEPITDLKQHGGSLLINEGFKYDVQFESFNQAVRDSKEYLYMEYDHFEDQTWRDLEQYFQNGTVPTDEDAPNYWWYQRAKNIQK